MNLTASDNEIKDGQLPPETPELAQSIPTKPSLKSILVSHWPLIVFTFVGLTVRLLTAPAFNETREGILYVRGVIRYSVTELRPYWPGYPVYIWVGKLFNLVIADPTAATRLVSIVFSTLSLWPIAAISAAWCRNAGGSSRQAKLTGICAALFWIALPISWLTGSEVLGDPLALFLALVLLWLSSKSLDKAANPQIYLIVAGIVAGLMLGVRLAYLPFLGLLGYAVWRNRKFSSGSAQPFFKSLPFLTILSLAGTVSLWLGWQIAVDGFGFFTIGTTQLGGHYLEWGNSAVSDHNLIGRPFRLFYTFLEYGLGGWWPGKELTRIPLTLLLVGLVILGIKQMFTNHQPAARVLVLIWFGGYTVCTLLNYDVDLTRYTLPLVAITCIMAALGCVTFVKFQNWLIVSGVVIMVAVSAPLAIQHRTSLPPGVALSQYIAKSLDPRNSTILINDDTASLLFLLEENAPTFKSIRVRDTEFYNVLKSNEAAGRSVYATWLEGDAPPNWVLVKAFYRNLDLESRGPLMIGLYRRVLPTKT